MRHFRSVFTRSRSRTCSRTCATYAIARGSLVTLNEVCLSVCLFSSSLTASLFRRGDVSHAFGRPLQMSRRSLRSLASSQRAPRVPPVPRQQGEGEERAEHGDAASRVAVTSPPPRHRAEKPEAHGIAHHGAQPTVFRSRRCSFFSVCKLAHPLPLFGCRLQCARILGRTSSSRGPSFAWRAPCRRPRPCTRVRPASASRRARAREVAPRVGTPRPSSAHLGPPPRSPEQRVARPPWTRAARTS